MYRRKYFLAGTLFGFAFPIVATTVEALTRHGGLGLAELMSAHRSPLVWIVGSAPLFLGLFASFAGVRQDRLVAAELERRQGYALAAAELATAAERVGVHAARIHARAVERSGDASRRAAAIAQTTSAATEIAQTSSHAQDRASAVIAETHRSEDLSLHGQRAVEQVVDGLEKLGAQVGVLATASSELAHDAARIGEVAAVVKDLAEQSDVLALNAGIEAAKAGEAGRGFAVVAAEVRRLSEQSRRAAGQVRTLLGAVVARARDATEAGAEGTRRAAEAVAIARGATDAIDGLAEVVRGSAAVAGEIAAVSGQQRSGIEQIVAAMSDLSAATAATADGAAADEASARELAEMARALEGAVARARAAAGAEPSAGEPRGATRPGAEIPVPRRA